MDIFLRLLIPLFLLCLAVFIGIPEIDLSVSSLFYRLGDGFFLQDNLFLRAVFYSVEVVTVSYILFVIVGFIWVMTKKRPFLAVFGKKALFFLFLSSLIGNLLVINETYKDLSGRARPSKIIEFGGQKHFSAPVLQSHNCDNHNCSFASGHVGLAFSLFAFAFILPAYRSRIFFGALAYAVLTAFARIAQGGHFLSDTVFAALSVAFCVQGAYYFVYRKERDMPRSYRVNTLFFTLFFVGLYIYYHVG